MEGSPDAFAHLPVMGEEVAQAFSTVPAGTIVDATVGGGGHAALILESRSDVELVGIDQDEDALAASSARLTAFTDRATLVRARFDAVADVLNGRGVEHVSGVLFDLGVSSPQLDRPERGFSYREEGPLDMRMDRSSSLAAFEVVNGYDEAKLAELLARHADERFARRIARAVVAARPVTSTTELAEVVRSAIPAAARRRGGHPARRTFQALRMEVNDELAVLGAALEEALGLLAARGRCVVISYHSGEDRIVKAAFRRAESGGCECPPGLPCVCGAVPMVRAVGRRSLRPSAAEVEANPRSRSARMRTVERLEP